MKHLIMVRIHGEPIIAADITAMKDVDRRAKHDELARSYPDAQLFYHVCAPGLPCIESPDFISQPVVPEEPQEYIPTEAPGPYPKTEPVATPVPVKLVKAKKKVTK